MLKYYAQFADALTDEQQETIEMIVIDTILNFAAQAKTEKDYYGIKYGISVLSEARPDAHAKAVTLRDNLMQLYPRKPLFLAIMKDLDL